MGDDMGGYYYETAEGDMWDYIAYKIYGDEYSVNFLMEAPENAQYLETYIFSAGIRIWAPETEESAEENEIPSWRTDDDSEVTDDEDYSDENDEESDDESEDDE